MRKDQVKNKEELEYYFKNHRFNNLTFYTEYKKSDATSKPITKESYSLEQVISKFMRGRIVSYFKNGKLYSGLGDMKSVNDTILGVYSIFGIHEYTLEEIVKCIADNLKDNERRLNFCYDIRKWNYWGTYYKPEEQILNTVRNSYLYREGFLSLPVNFSYGTIINL